MAKKKRWIVQKGSEEVLENLLNKLEQEEGTFELHGIYPTGQLEPGAGGFADPRPQFLIVGWWMPPKPVQVA